MRLVFAVTSKGEQTYLFAVDNDFDLQAWAESRRKAFRLLDVASLFVREINLP